MTLSGDDPNCWLTLLGAFQNGFMTQSMRSNNTEALTVIAPRVGQLTNERLSRDSDGELAPMSRAPCESYVHKYTLCLSNT